MRILIVEDERVAARGLERMIRGILGDRITSLRVQETLTAGECFVDDHLVDVLFLDLNLGGENGFELLRSAAASAFQTIVVSANTDKAIEAFEYGVLDFVPKPVDVLRLGQALERLGQRNAIPAARKLAVRRDDRTVLLALRDVAFFKGSDNYVEIQMAGGGVERHRKTLDELERTLPLTYLRVHKSYLVDHARVREVQRRGASYEALLDTGHRIPVSRAKARTLKSGPA